MVEVVTALRAQAALGEGPVWCPREQALYWVDIMAPAVHRFDPRTGENLTHPLQRRVGALALRDRGGMVLAVDAGFAFFDPSTGALDPIDLVEADRPENRFNDGKCDRRGRFWAGSLHLDNVEPTGSLYRLDGDLTVSRMETGIICSNGLGWSPDDTRMYYVDSKRGAIYCYDFDAGSGAIANRQVFVAVLKEHGVPDGLTVDSEGCVWCVLPRAGGRIVRYDPDGRVERMVELPVPLPTSCIFGGPGLDIVYVTSERASMSAAELAAAPQSGDLFAFEAGVRGLPEPRFAG